MNSSDLSRRSFMKKTTALAVGISATTLFSGLVHAATKSSVCNGVIGAGGCTRDAAVPTTSTCTVRCKPIGNVTMTCSESSSSGPSDHSVGGAPSGTCTWEEIF